MMLFFSTYASPLGELLLSADEIGLTGLYFKGTKLCPVQGHTQALPIFVKAKAWLDLYFGKAIPDFTPPMHLIGTPFQMAVWEMLLAIPYGETVTYGGLARTLAERSGGRISAQAVGGAVGRNHISIIVPCHRVIGADGSLTGYAGGIERKQTLLLSEGHIITEGKVNK